MSSGQERYCMSLQKKTKANLQTLDKRKQTYCNWVEITLFSIKLGKVNKICHQCQSFITEQHTSALLYSYEVPFMIPNSQATKPFSNHYFGFPGISNSGRSTGWVIQVFQSLEKRLCIIVNETSSLIYSAKVITKQAQ